MPMGAYCKHGEYVDRCRTCRTSTLDLRYTRPIVCVPAVAARVSDDLLELLGRLAQQQLEYAADGRSTAEIDAMIAHIEAVRAYAEQEAALA